VRKFAMLDLVLAVKKSRRSAATVASKMNSESAEMKISAVRKSVEKLWTVEITHVKQFAIQAPALNVLILLKR
jgi:hypothetical protein